VKIAVVGLGYVGLPLAVAFSKNYEVIGFDVSSSRVAELREGVDSTDEIAAEDLAGAKLTISYQGEAFPVTKDRFIIGRGKQSSDLTIKDPNVSRRHAELRQEGASYWIVDLDSTNGVEVNGRRVKRAKLESGDSFTVGSTDITFTTERE